MTTYDDENFVSNSSISLETPEIEKLASESLNDETNVLFFIISIGQHSIHVST